jgi:hypothetical protein
MVKNLSNQELQKIVNFIKENYNEAPEHLYPKTVEELLKRDGESEVLVIEDGFGIEGLSFFKFISPKLVENYRTVVRLDTRRKGVSKKLSILIEGMIVSMGATKIKCHIYVDNYPSIFRRIKSGFLIEGLLRNHEEKGRHEYVLGKELKTQELEFDFE